MKTEGSTITEKMVIAAIRKIIDQRRRQQKAVAIDAGMSESALSNILNEKRRIRMDEYIAVCWALDVDPTIPLVMASGRTRAVISVEPAVPLAIAERYKGGCRNDLYTERDA